MTTALVRVAIFLTLAATASGEDAMENVTDTSGVMLSPAVDSGDIISGTAPGVLDIQVPPSASPSPSPPPSPTPVVETMSEQSIAKFAMLRKMENREAVTGVHREGNTYTMAEFDRKVSLIIKTFERAVCLLKYIESIRKYYPTMTILIADDSKQISNTSSEIFQMKNVLYYPLPFDTGVSAGRNFLIDHVQTPFFIVSDDDNVFTENTKLENILADIESSGADIVGACNYEGDKECMGDWDMFYRDRVRNPFHKHYEAQYSTLQVREVPHLYMERVKQRDGSIDMKAPYCKESDMVANFFIARTAFIAEEVRWDPFFKVGEHEDFFYRAKIAKAAIRFCTNTQLRHEHFTCLKTSEQHAHYKSFRDRVRNFLEHFFVKHEPVTTLETPWATITWVCKCSDDYYASAHGDECMAPMINRTDCYAEWNTDRVTSPTDEELERWNQLLSQKKVEIEDNVAYPRSQGSSFAQEFHDAMTDPPQRLTNQLKPKGVTLNKMEDSSDLDPTQAEVAGKMMKAMF